MTMRDWLMPLFMMMGCFTISTMAICAAIFRLKEATLWLLMVLAIWMISSGLLLMKMDLSFGP